jgi:hypothetical protein
MKKRGGVRSDSLGLGHLAGITRGYIDLRVCQGIIPHVKLGRKNTQIGAYQPYSLLKELAQIHYTDR